MFPGNKMGFSLHCDFETKGILLWRASQHFGYGWESRRVGGFPVRSRLRKVECRTRFERTETDEGEAGLRPKEVHNARVPVRCCCTRGHPVPSAALHASFLQSPPRAAAKNWAPRCRLCASLADVGLCPLYAGSNVLSYPCSAVGGNATSSRGGQGVLDQRTTSYTIPDRWCHSNGEIVLQYVCTWMSARGLEFDIGG